MIIWYHRSEFRTAYLPAHTAKKTWRRGSGWEAQVARTGGYEYAYYRVYDEPPYRTREKQSKAPLVTFTRRQQPRARQATAVGTTMKQYKMHTYNTI